MVVRPVRTIQPGDSWLRAAAILRDASDDFVPVTLEDRFIGVVTEHRLGQVLAEGLDLTAAAEAEPAQTILGYRSAADAMCGLMESGQSQFVVTDDRGILLGVVGFADLYPRPVAPPVLPMVGGMATPFGVYLTTGSASGGANKWALVATGLTMFTFLAVGNYFGSWLALDVIGNRLPSYVLGPLADVLALTVFMLGLRLSPLSGIHGAEHKVVHALERGETLSLDVVRRMPRVHPRCGTNLAAGMMIFLAIFRTPWVPNTEVRLLIAVIATMLLWKPVGSLMQRVVTTSNPNDSQVESAIASAQDLVKNFSLAHSVRPNPWQRVWNMGILQVIAGSLIGAGILLALAPWLGIDVRL